MKVCLKCNRIFTLTGWTCPLCGYAPICSDGFEIHAEGLVIKSSGFKSEYFAELLQLEAANFWFRARNELIIWALQTYTPDVHKFLEVGCGTGFVLSGISNAFPDAEISGSEIFLNGLSYAAQRVPTASFMQMDARHVPYVDEFDAIGAFDVLEHIEEDEAVLAQLYKALKPGGMMLLTVPQHPQLWSALDEHACHVRRYTRAEIENKVVASGFTLTRSSSFVTMLLPAMIFSRLLKKRSTQSIDPMGELKIKAFLNRIFYIVMKAEIFGIRLGLNYSVGGSRLIVAKKC